MGNWEGIPHSQPKCDMWLVGDKLKTMLCDTTLGGGLAAAFFIFVRLWIFHKNRVYFPITEHSTADLESTRHCWRHGGSCATW